MGTFTISLVEFPSAGAAPPLVVWASCWNASCFAQRGCTVASLELERHAAADRERRQQALRSAQTPSESGPCHIQESARWWSRFGNTCLIAHIHKAGSVACN